MSRFTLSCEKEKKGGDDHTCCCQIDWKELEDLVEEASDDPVVSRIKKLNLKVNQMTMVLSNPFEGDGSGLTSSSEEEEEQSSDKGPVAVEIDIGLSAQANARYGR